MDEKVEIERLKLTNYIVNKENEILIGTINALAIEKEALTAEREALNAEIQAYRNSRVLKITKKIKSIIKIK